MTDPPKETQRRLTLAEEVKDLFADSAKGIVLAGSVAYGANACVTEASDLDMLVIAEQVKYALPHLGLDKIEQEGLEHRFFEGYCVKHEEEDIPVSIHVLSEDAFDIVSKCFVADMRVYRRNPKPGTYQLQGFEGNSYTYRIKNIPLDELRGVRTIVPLSFIHQDRYLLGIHRDKLLSNPVVLYEKGNAVHRRIDKLWRTIAENLCDESYRVLGCVDLDRMNVLNALAKQEKFTEDVRREIKARTAREVTKVK